MAVYVFAKIKGGEGASTHACNFTAYLAAQGRDVLLIDADGDNESSYMFTAKRNEQTGGKAGFSCIKLEGMEIRHESLRMKPKYDDLIIDVGAKDSASLRAAFTVADKFLVPFCPSAFDMWTFQKIEGVILEMEAANPSIRCFSFLNKIDAPKAKKGKPDEKNYSNDTIEAADFLKSSQKIRYLDAPLAYRKVFQQAPAMGLSVFEAKDEKAAEEAALLFGMMASPENNNT